MDKTITLFDLLELLGFDETRVTVRLGKDAIIGNASCSMWDWMKIPRPVQTIEANEDGLTVWLVGGDAE